MENNRYDIGLRNLKKIDKEAGEKVVESLVKFSPDLVKYIVEYAFGDIYNRPELPLKSKELVVVAALTSMGNAEKQLKVHIHGALNVGCNIAEIQEVILQMSIYSGFPNTINGMLALKSVVEDRILEGIKDEAGVYKHSANTNNINRYELGSRTLTLLNPLQVDFLENNFKKISPDLTKFIIEFGFSDILSRPVLNLKYREMVTIAALTAMGTAPSQLKFHIQAGLNVGISEVEIREIMILMSVYTGFPASINGTLLLIEVVNESEN